MKSGSWRTCSSAADRPGSSRAPAGRHRRPGFRRLRRPGGLEAKHLSQAPFPLTAQTSRELRLSEPLGPGGALYRAHPSPQFADVTAERLRRHPSKSNGSRPASTRRRYRARSSTRSSMNLEVLCVVGQQRDAVDVGGRGDRQVEGPAAGAAAALGDGRREACRTRRQRSASKRTTSKRSSSDGEPAHPACASVVVGRDQDAEVQLGERYHADRHLLVGAILGADQHRGVEQDGHCRGSLGGPGIDELLRPVPCRCLDRGYGSTGASPEVGEVGRRPPTAGLQAAAARPARPETVIVISSPASALRSTSPMLLRSSFCGIVVMPRTR